MVIQSLNFPLNAPTMGVTDFSADFTVGFWGLEKVGFLISKGFWSSVSILDDELSFGVDRLSVDSVVDDVPTSKGLFWAGAVSTAGDFMVESVFSSKGFSVGGVGV